MNFIVEKSNPKMSATSVIKKKIPKEKYAKIRSQSPSGRVARFFLVQHTKMGNIYQITISYTNWPQNIPDGRM
jgi:hypothetical protein